MTRDIAVVALNYIQFINIKPGIDALIKKGYQVDIYCPDSSNSLEFQNMFLNFRDYLNKNNYTVYDTVNDIEYKVLLEPYPYAPIKAKYAIKYRYGNISAKPNKVYLPENLVKYDLILCSGKYDSNYLSVFGKTFLTGNMKYINFKKRTNNKKKTLLYLPTFGEESSIEEIVNYLKILRKKYYVIAKIHHGTNFLESENKRIKSLESEVDELYDSYKDLKDLLEISDVVLTDNSGSIFEALYTFTPVAIFCKDANQNKLGDFNTIQYELIEEGIIPYTNDGNNIKNIVNQALHQDVIIKQKEWSKRNFYHPKDLVKDFVIVIEKFLRDDIDKRYYTMHNILKENYYKLYHEGIESHNMIANLELEKEKITNDYDNLIKANEIQKKKLNTMDIENGNLKKQLSYYENGKLYKIARKIYKIFKRG